MIKWERNYHREGLRNRDDFAFEWWSAEWFVIGLHVTNQENGKWLYKINGSSSVTSKPLFDTKEDAIAAVERRVLCAFTKPD